MDSDTTPQVITTKANGILRIQLNRLAKKNALSKEMYKAMGDGITAAENDPDISVTFLCGNETCFTAGNDLKDFQAASEADEERPAGYFLKALSSAQKPLVVAVGGPAVGIGTTILLHCDLVYAADNARFRLPFVNLGLCPEAASSYLLPKLAGYQQAAELLLLGEFFDAQKAKEIGLVNAIWPADALMAKAWEKAQKLAQQPQGALVLTKRLIKKHFVQRAEESMTEELVHFGAQLLTPEAKAAFASFLDK